MGPGNLHFCPALQGILTWVCQPYLQARGLKEGWRRRGSKTTSLSFIFPSPLKFSLRELGIPTPPFYSDIQLSGEWTLVPRLEVKLDSASLER